MDSFDKKPQKKAVVLPTDKSMYYVEKVNFGYEIERRMTCRVWSDKGKI